MLVLLVLYISSGFDQEGAAVTHTVALGVRHSFLGYVDMKDTQHVYFILH